MDRAEVQRIGRLVKALKSKEGCCFGTAENKLEALSDLSRAATSDEQRAAIVAAGGVPALAQLLGHSDSSMQAAAASVLGSLADGGESSANAVVTGGAVPALVRLLGHSDSFVQEEVLGTLLSLVCHSSWSRAAIEAAGAVPVLVRLLAPREQFGSEGEWQMAAACLLGHLAFGGEPIKAALVAAGAVPALVRLLDHFNSNAQQAAARALRRLSDDSKPSAAAIKAAGAVPALVRMLDHCDGEAQAAAARALGSLAGHDEQSKAAIVAADAVPALVQQLRHRSSEVKADAVAALCSLAVGSKPSMAAIVAADALPVLVCLLADRDSGVQAAAAGAMGSLAADSQASKAAVVTAGAVPALVRQLGYSDSGAQAAAARALGSLAGGDEATNDAIVEAGAVPALVKLFRSRSSNVLEAAAGALRRLAAGSESNAAAIVDAGAVPALEMLQGHSDSGVRAVAAAALRNLAAFSDAKHSGMQMALPEQLHTPRTVSPGDNANTAQRNRHPAGQPAQPPKPPATPAAQSPPPAAATPLGSPTAPQPPPAAASPLGPMPTPPQDTASLLGSAPSAPPATESLLDMLKGPAVRRSPFVDSAMAGGAEAERQAVRGKAEGPRDPSIGSIAAKLGIDETFGLDSRPTDSAQRHANPGATGSSGSDSAQRHASPGGMGGNNRSGTSGSNGFSIPAPSVSFTTAPSCSTVKWTDLELQDREAGSGSFGTVLLATLEETPVAAKVLVPLRRGPNGLEAAGTLNERQLEKFHRECSLLASVRHPNIVQIMSVCEDPPTIIMEYCSRGSLLDVLREARGSPRHAALLSWPRRLAMALDAARGILYMHKRGIAHRDLKSPNLLVDGGWRVKVADFGFCKVVDDGTDVMSTTLNRINPKWQAPEVLFGQSATTASDVYAMGVILWELMTWDVPWNGVVAGRVFGLKMNGEHLDIPPPEKLSTLPGTERDRAAFQPVAAQFTQLIEQCWETKPADRPTFKDIAQRLTSIKDEVAA